MKYSVLCSHFKPMFEKLSNRLVDLIPSDPKVLVLPLAFPVETTKEALDNEWINVKKDRYLDGLYALGIKDENITIINCYRYSN